MSPWPKLLTVLTAALIGASFASSALGQAYPNKPVRIVVPFAAGSATDIVARLLADELRGAFDQSFIVDDKPGASATLAPMPWPKPPPTATPCW